MKKSNHIITVIFLLILNSCSVNEFDNYSSPNASIYGEITNELTGEPFETEQPDGVRINFIELEYETPEPIRIWAKANGTYRNDALFSGTYEIFLDELAGIPSPSQIVEVDGEREVNFSVTPFLSLDTISVETYGRTIVVNYQVNQNTADHSITERGLLLNNIETVSQRVNLEFTRRNTDEVGQFTDRIRAPEFGTFYLRLAARTDNSNGRYNYSEVMKIEVVDNGLEEPGEGPEIEEGRIFENFEEELALESWETQYNFTTEFVESEKVRITMGDLDGYGIFAKDNISYDLQQFPIFGIKIYSSPPDENWEIKFNDGQGDVVLKASDAMGVKTLADGSKLYYWDITANSDWEGEKTSNIQIAVVGSNQPLTFGWLRSFEDEASVEDEDFYEEGRLFELFEEEEALDIWETKYNFTTEFIEPGKVQITMGDIDGYGIFARNNATYDLESFPILAIKVYNTPPDENWEIKLNDGQIDVVLKASDPMGIKNMPDGSQIYYWNVPNNSDWEGEKTSNVQIAVVGTSQPLVFGWLKTFENEDSIK